MVKRVWLSLLVLLSVFPSVRLSAQGQGGGGPTLTGYLQPRFESLGESAVFYLRRARFGVQGNPTRWASYRVQVDARVGAGPTDSTGEAMVQMVDAFVSLTKDSWSLTMGQYKVPFSREELTSASQIPFGERTVAVDQIAPARDVGLMAGWRYGAKASVFAGVFNGEGDNIARNPDRRMMYAARAAASPGHGVEVAAAVARNKGVTAWEVDAAFMRGPLNLSIEYLDRDPIRGGYIQALYDLVTGTWQLIGRVEQVDLSSAPDNAVVGYGFGFQRFFGEGLKLQANYTVFDEAFGAVENNRLILQMQARW
jgi:phosphate-selective porin